MFVRLGIGLLFGETGRDDMCITSTICYLTKTASILNVLFFFSLCFYELLSNLFYFLFRERNMHGVSLDAVHNLEMNYR